MGTIRKDVAELLAQRPDRVKIALISGTLQPLSSISRFLRVNRGFKHMRLDDALTTYLRTVYGRSFYRHMNYVKRIAFYDELYKLDNNIHINHLLGRFSTTARDIVISDIRYVNELLALQNIGFTIVRLTTTRTKFRGISIKGLGHSTAGTIALQEAYGKLEPYSVPYSIMYEDRTRAFELVDRIIEKERAKSLGKLDNNGTLSS